MKKLVLLFIGFVVGISSVQSQTNYQPNWKRVAELFVIRSVKIEPGEKIVIRYHPEKDNGFMPYVREAILKSGGIIIAELTYPDKKQLAIWKSLSEKEKQNRVKQENESYRKLLRMADVFLRLHSGSSGYDEPLRFEKLAKKFKGRNPHFHWFLPSDSIEKVQTIKMYEKALEIFPEELEKRQAALEQKIKGEQIRITHPNGTDITFEIPKNARFHHNNGNADKNSFSKSKAVRDKEQEFPSSGIRTTYINKINGKLVGVTFGGTDTSTVTIYFNNGLVTTLEPRGEEAKEFVDEYNKAIGSKDKVAELLIGTNPELKNILPSGFKPYYGSGYGNINIRIGDNWESGGKNKVSDHWQGLLYIINGTMLIGNTKIIEDGKILE
jgi:leucyl aminopeptidase (aminopeptidase T)